MYYLDSYGQSTDLGAPNAGFPVLFWVDGDQFPIGSYVAASLNRNGRNEVFVVGYDWALYVNSSNTPGQWELVDNSRHFINLSATVNDTVFAVDEHLKLYQESEYYQSSFGRLGYFYWSGQDISGGKRWFRISADTDAWGRDEVYAIADGEAAAYLHRQGSWRWLDNDVLSIAGAGGGYFYDVKYSGAYQFNPDVSPYGQWTYLG